MVVFRDDMVPAPDPVELDAPDDVVVSWETNGRDWGLKVYTVDGSKDMRPIWFGEGTLESAQAALNELLYGR